MKYVKPDSKHSKCAYRALTLSGISFFSAILNTVFLPFIFSPLAIIFSHLSRGRVKGKHIAAQAATVIAIISLIINIALTGLTIYRFGHDDAFKKELDEASQTLYGISFEKYTSELLNQIGVRLETE